MCNECNKYLRKSWFENRGHCGVTKAKPNRKLHASTMSHTVRNCYCPSLNIKIFHIIVAI